MNTAIETSGAITPQDVNPKRWWTVRPMLRSMLLLESGTAVMLCLTDSQYAAYFRRAGEVIALAANPFMTALPFMATAAVLAVFIEGVRSGRLSFRRAQASTEQETGKVQTATA